MKQKLLLTLIALFSVIGAKADGFVASNTVANPEHIYFIRRATTSIDQYWSTTGSNVNAASAAHFALFAGTKANEYYIYNTDENKYLTYTSTNNAKNQCSLVENQGDAKTWEITSATRNTVSCYQMRPYDSEGNVISDRYANWFSGLSENTSMGFWQDAASKDDGSAWLFESADLAYIKFGKPYYLTVNSNSDYNVFFGGNSGYTSYGIYTNPSSPNAGMTKFSVSIPNSAGKFYNVTDNTYSKLVAYKQTTAGASTVVPLVDANIEYAENINWQFRAKAITLNNNNGVTNGFVVSPGTADIGWNKHGTSLGLWGAYSAASVAVFVPADLETLNALLEMVKTKPGCVATPTVGQPYNEALVPFVDHAAYTEYNFADAKTLVNLYYTEAIIYNPQSDLAAEKEAAIAIINNLSALVGDSEIEGTAAYIAKAAIDEIVCEQTIESYNTAHANLESVMNTLYAAAAGTKFTYASWTNGGSEADPYYLKAAGATGALVTSTGEIERDNVFELEHVSGNTFKVKVPYYNAYLSTVSTAATGSNYELVAWGENYIGLQFANGTNAIHHQQDGHKPVSWSTTSDASKWHIAAVDYDALPDWNGLAAAIESVEAYPIGDGLGKYSSAEYGNADCLVTISLAKTALENKNRTMVNGHIEALNNIIASLAINQPALNKFYTIKNAGKFHKDGTNHYWNGTWVSTGIDKNTIFYLDEDAHLIQYGTGYYANGKNVANSVVETPQTYTFTEARSTWGTKNNGVDIAAYGDYCIHGSSMNGSLMTWEGSDAGTMDGTADPWAAWIIEEVEELPITIGSKGYSTFSAPVDIQIPVEVGAYMIQGDVINGKITLDEASSKAIPANTGMILAGTAGQTYNISTIVSDESANTDGNKLVANVTASTIEATASNYIFATVNDKLGFYRLSANGTLLGFKSYLRISSDPANTFIGFDGFDEETGIADAISTNTHNEIIYNIAGQKLNALQKGINIINGKKIMVK